MCRRIPSLLILAVVFLLPHAVWSDEVSITLGVGDDFVVKDSSAIDRLRVVESTGSVTIGQADITTGTIAGSANQGDIWYDNGTTIMRLAPGTPGRFLQTLGGGANPQWATPVAPTQVASNVIFQYVGQVDQASIGNGEITSTSLTQTGEIANYRFIAISAAAHQDVLRGRFLKSPGINTVEIHAYMWGTGGATASLQVIIGGQSQFVSTNATSPTWATPTSINVSSLTDGVSSPIRITLKSSEFGQPAKLGVVFLLGSG